MYLKKSDAAEHRFLRACALWDEGKYRRAFSLFMLAAKSGHAASRVNLGFFYDKGVATRRDVNKAMFWYLKAAGQRQASAAYNIGTIHLEKGRHKLAARWFRRATDLGDAGALVDLGEIYEKYMKDPTRARGFFLKALASNALSDETRKKATSLLRRTTYSKSRQPRSGI